MRPASRGIFNEVAIKSIQGIVTDALQTVAVVLLAALFHLLQRFALYLLWRLILWVYAHSRLMHYTLTLLLCAYSLIPRFLKTTRLRPAEVSLLHRSPISYKAIWWLKGAGIVKLKTPLLPTEIWGIILDYAIDEPLLFAPYSDASNLLDFLKSHICQDPIAKFSPRSTTWIPSSTRYEASERHRQRLSLVSRQWNRLLDRRSGRWLYSKMGDLHDQSMNAERIEMVFNWGDTQSSLQNHLHNYTQENYPKLSTLVVKTTQRNNHVTNEEFTHFCEYIPVSTRIKCLTLHSSYVSFTQAAIPLLSSAFSNLSSLILSTPSVEGKVCLPGLRVLYLRSDQIDISKWICPSLRHLVITPISRGLSSDHREYSSRVLPCPPTQLESLVLYSFAIEATSAFWDEHPSIQLLGFGQLQVTNQPSPIHPIKVLYNPSPYVYSTHPTYLREAIDLIPQLRGIRLIQRRVGAFTGPNEISEEWDSLYMACRRRGIEWQQEDDTIGSSPVYAWPEREKLTTDWHELSEQWLVEIFWGLVNGTLLTLSALVPLYQNTGPNWRSYQEICKVVSVFTCVTYQGLLLYSLMRKANRRLKWLGRLHGW